MEAGWAARRASKAYSNFCWAASLLQRMPHAPGPLDVWQQVVCTFAHSCKACMCTRSDPVRSASRRRSTARPARPVVICPSAWWSAAARGPASPPLRGSWSASCCRPTPAWPTWTQTAASLNSHLQASRLSATTAAQRAEREREREGEPLCWQAGSQQQARRNSLPACRAGLVSHPCISRDRAAAPAPAPG